MEIILPEKQPTADALTGLEFARLYRRERTIKFVIFQAQEMLAIIFDNAKHAYVADEMLSEHAGSTFVGAGSIEVHGSELKRVYWGSDTCIDRFGRDHPLEHSEEILNEFRLKLLAFLQSLDKK